MYEFVTPAKVIEGNAEHGGQEMNLRRYWIPAFAGMTGVSDFMVPS